MIERTKLKRSACQNPDTANPGTKFETARTKKAFIMKVKSPNVRMVKGKVKSTRIGLINILIAPRTTATINAVNNPSTITPGSIYALIITAIVFKINLINIFLS